MQSAAAKRETKQHSLPLEKVQISIEDGVCLSGLLGKPKKAPVGDIQVLILVHGFASEKTENGLFLEVADNLLRNGYFVLMYDWRGRGESGGNFENTSLNIHAEDFKKITNWIKNFTGVPPSRICAVGFSLGATIVAMSIMTGLKLGAASFLESCNSACGYDVAAL